MIDIMKKLFLCILFCLPAIANANEKYTIDRWHGAGGGTMFYELMITSNVEKLVLVCRLYDRNGDLIAQSESRHYGKGWHEAIINNSATQKRAYSIKCQGR